MNYLNSKYVNIKHISTTYAFVIPSTIEIMTHDWYLYIYILQQNWCNLLSLVSLFLNITLEGL